MKKHPTSWMADELRQLQANDLRRYLTCRESPPVAGMVQIDGQPYINFSSNDYLGLAATGELVDAVRHVVGQVGWGAGASPLVTGRGIWHSRLEQELASLKLCEAALLFPTGFAANVGAITSLVGKPDVIFSDQFNHASIIDGCRLSGATIQVYRHADVDHLQALLKQHHDYRRRLIVTDSLFSMHGDFAPLPHLVELAEKHTAMLMVDEAHATGVWGQRGSGVCEMQNVEERVPIRVGTLSKALGSLGGFVAGSHTLVQLVLNRARTYMFSTAQPEAIAAASLAALDIVRNQPQRRQRLAELSQTVRQALTAQGWDCGESCSQIIPVKIGSADAAVALSRQLRERGMLVPAIRPPAVPPAQSILRISLSSSHAENQVDRLLEQMQRLNQLA